MFLFLFRFDKSKIFHLASNTCPNRFQERCIIHASDFTIELPVFYIKNEKFAFLKNSSIDQGFGHKTLKTVDCQ